jgi:hypothetical protein
LTATSALFALAYPVPAGGRKMSVTTELTWDDFFTTPHPDEVAETGDADSTAVDAGAAARTN